MAGDGIDEDAEQSAGGSRPSEYLAALESRDHFADHCPVSWLIAAEADGVDGEAGGENPDQMRGVPSTERESGDADSQQRDALAHRYPVKPPFRDAQTAYSPRDNQARQQIAGGQQGGQQTDQDV